MDKCGEGSAGVSGVFHSLTCSGCMGEPVSGCMEHWMHTWMHAAVLCSSGSEVLGTLKMQSNRKERN